MGNVRSVCKKPTRLDKAFHMIQEGAAEIFRLVIILLKIFRLVILSR